MKMKLTMMITLLTCAYAYTQIRDSTEVFTPIERNGIVIDTTTYNRLSDIIWEGSNKISFFIPEYAEQRVRTEEMYLAKDKSTHLIIGIYKRQKGNRYFELFYERKFLIYGKASKQIVKHLIEDVKKENR